MIQSRHTSKLDTQIEESESAKHFFCSGEPLLHHIHIIEISGCSIDSPAVLWAFDKHGTMHFLPILGNDCDNQSRKVPDGKSAHNCVSDEIDHMAWGNFGRFLPQRSDGLLANIKTLIIVHKRLHNASTWICEAARASNWPSWLLLLIIEQHSNCLKARVFQLPGQSWSPWSTAPSPPPLLLLPTDHLTFTTVTVATLYCSQYCQGPVKIRVIMKITSTSSTQE